MSSFGSAGRRLGLGLGLIAASALVLLYSDAGQRRPARGALPRVAIMQYSSTQILDDGVRGILDSLRSHGYEAGRSMALDRFNAENDMPTASAIARQIVSGKYDYAITVSTNCLQAVANANTPGRVKQIFGVVADPIAAKVGINPNNPADHPKSLTGMGNLIPVGELLELARRFNPRLRTVGLPWNPSQTNSEKYTQMSRETARRMGINLIEGSVESTSAVGEVTSALVARGADAILLTGDQTVALGTDALLAAARRGKIPVLSTMPATVTRGVLFAIGADYHEIGRQVGDMAARVIGGADPAGMPILYITPRQYSLNRQALKDLKDTWQFPDDVLKQAVKII
jgi:putative tryptophan/tyrosine transport system substrate-binding protein